jgi:Protein of unknown function (DUF3445)
MISPWSKPNRMSAVAERVSAEPRWPGDDKDFRVTMGLHPCPPDAWLWDGASELIAAKRVILREHHAEAVIITPEGDAAAREAAQAIFHEVLRMSTRDGRPMPAEVLSDIDDDQHPLERVARLIGEDICIMTPSDRAVDVKTNDAQSLSGEMSGAQSPANLGDDEQPPTQEIHDAHTATADTATADIATADPVTADTATADIAYRLTAAVLCAPSRWSLREKIGQSVSAIHEPVPGYEAIESPTARFFERLRIDDIIERTNWTVLDSPVLFQPDRARATVAFTDAGALDAPIHLELFWLRLERQTLRKLPQSGAVIFTILTTNTRLDELAATSPAIALQLAHNMRTAPAATCDYKGWESSAVPIANALEAACLVA